MASTQHINKTVVVTQFKTVSKTLKLEKYEKKKKGSNLLYIDSC